MTGVFFPRLEDAQNVEKLLRLVPPTPVEEDGADEDLYERLMEDFDPERVSRYVDSDLLKTRSREAEDRRFELWCSRADTAEERLRELALPASRAATRPAHREPLRHSRWVDDGLKTASATATMVSEVIVGGEK